MDRTEHASRLLELRDTQSFQLSEKPSLRIYSSSRSCDKSEWPNVGASMPHVLLTFLFPANRTPPEAMLTLPPCLPEHADANDWTTNMTSRCSKPITCWDTPLPVGEMLYRILPAAALCGINQEQFQLLDYTQLKNSSVWEVLEHGSDLLLTHKRVCTPNVTGRTRQGGCLQSWLWYPQEEALCRTRPVKSKFKL